MRKRAAPFRMQAQAQTLAGCVTDAESHAPLEAVTISVMRGGALVDYALTDAQGRFSLAWKYQDTVQVSASYLGYRKEVRRISRAERLNFVLRPEAIVLKEVQIKGGRIGMRKDTVRYDLARFASSKDVYIKDVLKRLPGVDVEEDGKVTYKGKAIDHFLVEGMDVTGGRYNQVNNNLSAKAVKTAEIMENYQSVKALKDRIRSDEVALNLKLDPKARDQWFLNGSLGLGHGDETLWSGSLNALQLGRGRQSLYNYKTNNNGIDLSTEQTLFTGTSTTADLTPFLAQPGISAPLDKQRLLFNRTHTLNGNRMYRWNDERSLRLQAGYTHDFTRQERGNTALYFFQSGDTVRTDEQYHYRLRIHAAFAEATYEDNNPKHYLTNRFKVEGETERSTSQEIGQQIETNRLKASNTFRLLRNTEQSTWEVNSTVQYTYLPASLQVDDAKETYRQQSLYTDNSIAYLRKCNGLTRQLTAGLQGEWNSLRNTDEGNNNTLQATYRQADISNASIYFSPRLQLERGKWLVNLTIPLRGKRFFERAENHLLYSPNLYIRLTQDFHWKFSLFAGITRSTGSGTDLYPAPYRTNYRTWLCTNGLTPVSLSQSYNLYAEYKNTVQEFFVTFTISHQNTRQQTLNTMNVTQDSIVYTRIRLPHRQESWHMKANLSKGIYDWNLKTALNLSVNRIRGKQQTNGLLQSYRYDYLQAEPKITWMPSKYFEAVYHANIGYGGSKIGGSTRLTPLLDIVQRLRLTFSLGSTELRLSGEHYRNDLGSGTHVNTLLADASLVYKAKKWRMEVRVNNLFDKKEYAYTLYSTTQSATSSMNIRPREVMGTVSYQF
ncbi:MAG: carboxypeptidase-like regulatory domain-containing protein [Bacteroides sp.]|nr:carboxypeptidase-like regulatory domain-containing protein [Bacteroides sp.]